MSDPRDAFVIHRLRAKPVEYSVTIRHFVSEGEWQMSMTVEGAEDDTVNRLRVAEDLEVAASWLKGGSRNVTPEPQ